MYLGGGNLPGNMCLFMSQKRELLFAAEVRSCEQEWGRGEERKRIPF